MKQSNVELEERVITNHLSALKAALSFSLPLTCTVLQNWHRILCDGLPTKTAGMWRETGVHCGKVSFCAANLGNISIQHTLSASFVNTIHHITFSFPFFYKVSQKMEDYVRKVEQIMSNDALLPHGKAAAVAIWFMAIHPFSDGNGRMGRILCNWALKKCGYPFTLALCSTRPQVIPLPRLCSYLP